MGKRLSDIGLAVLLVPLVAPVVLVLWALARADGGPGFYVQARVGQRGQVFRCWKLRTMMVDAERALADLCAQDPNLAAEWARDQKLARDPRVTRLGRFLRATSLDELPQLWNVIRGDMSFVGPRPFMVDQEDMYRSGGGEAYFHLRPGITGYWQIEGRGKTTFLERVRYDNDYAATLSLLRDLRLMVRTSAVVFEKTGR